MKKTKSLPKLKVELQKIFNEFIRLRDFGKPCISCGEHKKLQAGHLYNVKLYDGLRYNEINVNGECARCNCFNDSHLIGYIDNLISRVGGDEFIKLKQCAADYKKNGYKWSRFELMELIEIYKDKVKQLEHESNN